MIIYIYLLLFLLLISAIFSASETSLIAINKLRLNNSAKKGVKNAGIAYKLVTNIDRLIATILVGNNLVNIAITVISTVLCIQFFGNDWGIPIATGLTTITILIFSEITPKILAANLPEPVALFVAPIMQFFIFILHPITRIFTIISNIILRMFGVTLKARSPLITEEEIRLMIEVGKEEGLLGDEERKMLHRIFEFGDIMAKDVMVGRAESAIIDINSSQEGLLEIIVEENHSRIPVYSGSKDNIVGIIYARDILYLWKNKSLIIIPDIVRAAFYILPTKRVIELLRDFQRMRIHIAIVVDENKKFLGVVTLEDLIEEIVGDIEQERPQ